MKKKYNWTDWVIVLLDIAAVNASYLAALYARFYGFNFGELFHSYLSAFWRFAPFYTVISIAIFVYFKLYGSMWRYAGMHDLNRIISANISTCIVQVLGTLLFLGKMPITYYILGALFQFALTCAIRLGYRIIRMEKAKIIRHNSPAENVMIVGHGENVKKVMEYLENESKHNLRPVCIIDSRNSQVGLLMNFVPMIGGAEKIVYGREK